MLEALARKLLRRPGKVDNAGLTGHTDTPPNPATVSISPPVRPIIRPVRPNIEFTPTMPAPTRDPNAPLISSKLLKRPMPAEFETGAPITAVSTLPPPANNTIRPLRPGRDSEVTSQKIREAESSPAQNEDKGFKSKAWDVFKQSGKNFLKGYAQTGNLGYAAGSAIAGGGAQVMDPSLDEKQAKQKKLAELYELYSRQTKMEAEQEKIRRQEADTDNIFADNRRDDDKQALAEKKYDLDVDKSLDKRDFDEWRMQNGDAKLSETQNYNAWRKSLGDKKQASDEEYRKWRRDAQKADIELRRRQIELTEKRDASNARIQGERLQISREQQAQRTRQYVQKNKLSLAQFKAQLDVLVSSGKATQEQADQAYADAQ